MKKKKIIKFCMVLLLFIIPSIITAQNTEYSFKKLWNYQNRLRYYVNPSCDTCTALEKHGEGLIMNPRNLCVNPVASYGQENIVLGYYIGVLATEYRLLANNGQSVDALKALNELNRVLDEVIRKDECAESRAPWNLTDYYDGFFIREDIFSDESGGGPGHTSSFLNHHELNFGLTSNDNYWNPSIHRGIPLYINSLGDTNSDESLYYRADGTPYSHWPSDSLKNNAMSQDESIGLFLGMALVHKFAMGTTADDKAKEITDLIIMKIRNNDAKGLNWDIHYPDGSKIDNHHGGRCGFYSYGIAKAGVYIVRPHKGIRHYLTAVGRLGSSLIWKKFIPNYCLMWCKSINMHMEATLGDIGYSWKKNTAGIVHDKTFLYNWEDFYLLFYKVLHNSSKTTLTAGDWNDAWNLALEQMANAPCYGPYCYQYGDNNPPEFSPYGWGSSLKFTHDTLDQNQGEHGDRGSFSGVDYMLLYNLNNILFCGSSPPYINCSDRTLSGTLPLLAQGLGTNNNPQKYNVIHSIESTQIIDNVTAPNPSGNSGNITYRAGTSISLLPGFAVSAGATFWALIKKLDICTDNDTLINRIDYELKTNTSPLIDSTLCGTLYYCNTNNPIPYDTILLVENGIPEYEHVDTAFLDTIVIGDTTFTDSIHLDSTVLVNGISIVTDAAGNFCFEETDLLELGDSINYSFTTTTGSPLSPNISQNIEAWMAASPIKLYLGCGKRIRNQTEPEQNMNIPVKVYPNPNNGGWEVDYYFPDGLDGHFELYDAMGRKIKDYLLDAGKNKLSITENNLQNGVYTYQVIHNNSLVAKDKLVIIKN